MDVARLQELDSQERPKDGEFAFNVVAITGVTHDADNPSVIFRVSLYSCIPPLTSPARSCGFTGMQRKSKEGPGRHSWRSPVFPVDASHEYAVLTRDVNSISQGAYTPTRDCKGGAQVLACDPRAEYKGHGNKLGALAPRGGRPAISDGSGHSLIGTIGQAGTAVEPAAMAFLSA